MRRVGGVEACGCAGSAETANAPPSRSDDGAFTPLRSSAEGALRRSVPAPVAVVVVVPAASVTGTAARAVALLSTGHLEALADLHDQLPASRGDDVGLVHPVRVRLHPLDRRPGVLAQGGGPHLAGRRTGEQVLVGADA